MKKIESQLKTLKVVKITAGIIIALNFIYILGIAGASDNDLLPFHQIVAYSSLGLALFASGFGIIWLVEKREEILIKKFNRLCECRENSLEHKKRRESRERSLQEYMRRTELERKQDELFRELSKIHEDLDKEETMKK